MARFSTYADLRDGIAKTLARSDLTDDIPAFVALAETRISRDLRVRWMEQRSQAITEGGTSWLDVPADFLEARRFVLKTTPNRNLTFLSPADLVAAYGGRSGMPQNYSILGQQFELGPMPDAAYPVELIYYASLAPLDDAMRPSNWCLIRYPDLYLYGALIETAPFLKEDERLATWLGLYDRAVAAIKGEDARAKYNGAPLAMRLDMRVG
ncbi:MAG: hypothetical protein K2Q10_03755 [Rhodospirillales bacterium]|nr:hypothetical protein [Rhodospirillales bacterium]